jgi:putative SOS response-associated peptidase YedK
VPVTTFFEYSTPPGWRKGQPKTRHEIAWPGAELRFFAGVWDRTDEGLESFAIVTGPAGPDMAPIHDRQPPLMTLDQGLQWLRLDGPGKAPLHELPTAGEFTVQRRPRESLMSAAMRRALP